MILKLFNVGEIFISLIANLYRTVASTYDLMMGFIKGENIVEDLLSFVEEVTDSIYVLIAVFMLFRISVTMLQYLIDPDRVSDKNTGAGKLITRIIVSLALVIAFPTIMNKVYELQDALLDPDESILFKFFQEDKRNNSSSNNLNYVPSNSYFAPNDVVVPHDKCIENLMNMSDAFSGGNRSVETALTGCYYSTEFDTKIDQLRPDPDKFECYDNDSELKITCNGSMYIARIEQSDPKKLNVNDYEVTYKYYLTSSKTVAEEKKEEVGEFEGSSVIFKDSDGLKVARNLVASFFDDTERIRNSQFLKGGNYDYEIRKEVEEETLTIDVFMAIICGLVFIVLFLILSIEIVIRHFKLLVLQILAPIAFMSYMNPNDKVLGNWFQKFIGCYLDLFLKIFAINLAILFIDKLSGNPIFNTNAIGTILLWIGLFLFAKTVPNLITDVLGIKNMGGSFKDSMNALKTAAFTGAGAVAGAGAGLITGLGKGAGFSTAVGGLFGGAFRGAQGGAKGNVLQGATTQAKRNEAARQSNIKGGSWWQRRRASVGIDSATMADREITRLDEQKKRYDEMAGYQKTAEDIAESSNYMKDLRAENEAARTNGGYVLTSKEIEDERDKWAGVQAAAKMSLDRNDGKYEISDGKTAIGGRVYQSGEIIENQGGNYSSTGYIYEGGKAAGIAACITQAEYTRSGSGFFKNDENFKDPIYTVSDMKDAAKESKKRASNISNEEVKIKHTSEYLAGEESRNASNQK